MERLILAERMGWELEYIDDLRETGELEEIMIVLDALDRGRAFRANGGK